MLWRAPPLSESRSHWSLHGIDAFLLALDMHNAALSFQAWSLDLTQKQNDNGTILESSRRPRCPGRACEGLLEFTWKQRPQLGDETSDAIVHDRKSPGMACKSDERLTKQFE